MGSRHWRRIAALSFSVMFLLTAAARAEKVALVIGNSVYRHTSTLRSPVADLTAMAQKLEALGYDVERVPNANRVQLGRALQAFGRRAERAEKAVIYYSGHGMELDGRNYVIPTDAALDRPADAKYEAVALDAMIEEASRASVLSVVIVDACRSNSFPSPTKSVSKGFKPVNARPGQVVVFATAPGEVAFDGGGALSPFTRALVEALETRSMMDVRILFTGLGRATARYAKAEQRPFTRIGDMPPEMALVTLGDEPRIGAVTPPARPERPVRAAPAPSVEAPEREEERTAPSPPARAPAARVAGAVVYRDGAWKGGSPPPMSGFDALDIAVKYCTDSWGDCGRGDYSWVAPAGHNYRTIGLKICADNGVSYRLTHEGKGVYRYEPFAALPADEQARVEANTAAFADKLATVKRANVGDALLMRTRGVAEQNLFSEDKVCTD